MRGGHLRAVEEREPRSVGGRIEIPEVAVQLEGIQRLLTLQCCCQAKLIAIAVVQGLRAVVMW